MSTNTNLRNYLIQSKLCGLYGGGKTKSQIQFTTVRGLSMPLMDLRPHCILWFVAPEPGPGSACGCGKPGRSCTFEAVGCHPPIEPQIASNFPYCFRWAPGGENNNTTFLICSYGGASRSCARLAFKVLGANPSKRALHACASCAFLFWEPCSFRICYAVAAARLL